MAVATASTFTVENHEGFLYNLSPMDTKLFSMLGGLFGGEPVNAPVIPWQEHELRDPAVRARTEGDDHPSSTLVTRSPVHNVLQIVHESIDTSWRKRATSAALKAIGANHPNIATVGMGNPVGDEHPWQQAQQVKEVVRDVEHALWNGGLVDPSTVGTAPETEGIISATTTNVLDGGSGGVNVTGEDGDDLIDDTGTAFEDGDKVQFTAIEWDGAGGNFELGVTYYVVSQETNGFKLAASPGGSPIDFGDDLVATTTIEAVSDVDADAILDLMQLAYDNGGINEGETATLWANSWNKRRISKALITDQGYEERSRNIAGVECTTIITDFGDVNVLTDRFMPKNTIQVISMEELKVCFLMLDTGEKIRVRDLQDSGGSRDRTVLYFEFGLRYGNELKHAKHTGLSTR